jgi:hypothetical protein
MESQSKSLPETCPGGYPPNGDATQTDKTGSGSGHAVKNGKRKRRSWGRGLLVALVLGACLYGFRAPVLRSIAGYLVVDQPAATADYLLILPDADRRYDHAAQLYHAGSATSILLVERRPKRLERMGFQPTFEAMSQRELTARGVPANAITVIPGKARTDWERARCLRDWLREQPPVRVLVLGDRFGGRKLRYILDQVLETEYASRVRLRALPDRSFDESDWWQYRGSTILMFDAYLNLAYARLCGEETEEWREWDPEEFKKSLR